MKKMVVLFCAMMMVVGCDEADKMKEKIERPHATINKSQNAVLSTNKSHADDEPALDDNKTADATVTPVIDATNEETMNSSLNAMLEPLSDSEKEAFAEAFLIYTMSKVDMSVSDATNQKNILAALNGKSVKDIMTEATKIVKDQNNNVANHTDSSDATESTPTK